jgi:hypothetical protein
MATRILAIPHEHHDQQPQMDATLALARMTPLCEDNSKTKHHQVLDIVL